MAQVVSHGGYATEPSVKFAMINCPCCSRKIPGKIKFWPGSNMEEFEKEEIPLWTPCKECGVWLSHLEEDSPNLKGRCFECHQEKNL
jgi:hypothetical protein